jgi:hypothetical protein
MGGTITVACDKGSRLIEDGKNKREEFFANCRGEPFTINLYSRS